MHAERKMRQDQSKYKPRIKFRVKCDDARSVIN